MKKSIVFAIIGTIAIPLISTALLFWQNMMLREQNLAQKERLSVVAQNIAPVVNNFSFKNLPQNTQQHMTVIAGATGVRIDYGSEK